CSQLAKDVDFAAALNVQARRASVDWAWAAIQRFYAVCHAKTPDKKRCPRCQHDNHSVEYKATGWKLAPDGWHLTRSVGARSDVCGWQSTPLPVRLGERSIGRELCGASGAVGSPALWGVRRCGACIAADATLP